MATSEHAFADILAFLLGTVGGGLQKLPVLGEYWDREIPPSDNVCLCLPLSLSLSPARSLATKIGRLHKQRANRHQQPF